MRLGDVPIPHGKLCAGLCPDGLGCHVDGLGFNLGDEVVAALAAPRILELITPDDRHPARLDQFAFFVQRCGPVEARPGGKLPRLVLGHVADCLDESISGAFADRAAFPEKQPRDVGVHPGGRDGVGAVKAQDVLKQFHRLKVRRAGVGGLRVPREKLVERIKHRVGRLDFKRILRLCCCEFARGVKGKRLVRDEVVQHRPVILRQCRLGQQVGEVAGWDGLETAVGEGVAEVQVDFPVQSRQIPRGEVFPKRFGCRGALHETIAVLPKILPVPVAQHGLEQWLGLDRHLAEFVLQAGDFFLRLAALHSALVGDALGQSLDCLGVFAFLERGVVDRLQLGGGGFGPSFFFRLGDLFPERLAVHRLRLAKRQPDSEQKKSIQKLHGNIPNIGTTVCRQKY